MPGRSCLGVLWELEVNSITHKGLRPYWKKVLDLVSPLFVLYYFYLLMAASHHGPHGFVMLASDWRTKFVLFTIVFAGLAIVWTIALLVRIFPHIGEEFKAIQGTVWQFVYAVAGAIILLICFLIGTYLLHH